MLQSFKDEVSEVIQNGIQIANIDHKFGVEISCFVCDSPARAFVKQTTGHSGYFGLTSVCRGVHGLTNDFPRGQCTPTNR